MNFDVGLFVKKVKNLMTQQGHSVDSIITNTNLSRNRLNEILECRSIPSGDEVLILSELFTVDFRHLISNQETAQFEKTEKLFRTNSQVLSVEDRRLLSRILYMASFAKVLNDERHIAKYNFTPRLNRKTYAAQGKEAAAGLRAFLKLNNNFDNRKIYQIAKDLGIQIYRLHFSNSEISGIHLHNDDTGSVIVVNQLEDAFRQNFTLIHELCHSLLDNNEEYKISFNGQNTKDEEVRANNFAASFLVPDAFISRITASTITEDLFMKIAKRQFVNPETLAIRLKENKRISSSEYGYFRKLKIRKAEKADVELLELTPNGLKRVQQIQNKGFSLSYITLLYSAYADSQISFLKMSEMLFLSPKETETLIGELGWKLNA